MADGYTPSDDEVRESYVDICVGMALPEFQEARTGTARASFDRWLRAHDARIAREALGRLAAEQERKREEAVFADDAEEALAALDARDRALQYSHNFFRESFHSDDPEVTQ